MTNIVNLFKKGTTVVLALVMSMMLLSAVTGSIDTYAGGQNTGSLPGGSLDRIDETDDAAADEDTAQEQVFNLILDVVQFLVYIVGAIAVLFLVYGGFLFIVDPGGNGDGATKGKTIIFNALIGLVVAIVATGIVQFVGSLAANNGFI